MKQFLDLKNIKTATYLSNYPKFNELQLKNNLVTELGNMVGRERNVRNVDSTLTTEVNSKDEHSKPGDLKRRLSTMNNTLVEERDSEE